MPILFNQGLNTSKDRSDLDNGELQQATGIYYKKGDPTRAHKIGGRADVGTVVAGRKIRGVNLLTYDSGGTDRLVALALTPAPLQMDVWSSTDFSNFTTLPGITDIGQTLSTMIAAHSEDRWYLCFGSEENYVVESDGSTRTMGMESPVEGISAATANSGGEKTYPSANAVSNFTNPTRAYDEDTVTYANGTLDAEGTATLTLTTFTGGDGTRSPKQLKVRWKLAGAPIQDPNASPVIGFGGVYDTGWDVDVKIELDTNSGGDGFDKLVFEQKNMRGPTGIKFATYNDITVNDNVVQVKCTLTYNSGFSNASLRIYEVYLTDGGAGPALTKSEGFYYAVSEFDKDRGLESAPGSATDLVTLEGENQVTLTLPSAKQNTNATHWRIYRTHNGGSVPRDLYELDTVDISKSSYIDDLVVDIDTAGNGEALALIRIVATDGKELYLPANTKPPSFKHLSNYRGSLVGVEAVNQRSLRFSVPASPESWPEIYVIQALPLPEHDTLVATVTVGESLLIAADSVMLRMDDLPRPTAGEFAPTVHPLRKQPGCVGVYAITEYSVEGEPRAAWVSRFGVHVTNGFQSDRISSDIDWDNEVSTADLSTAVLHWDRKRACLIFAVDTGGSGNDRFYLIHMSPEHRKANGQPKWTGPHYGDITALTSGIVSNAYNVYSAHWSDGKVYQEDSGTTDQSDAYSGTQLPFIVKTGRDYGPRNRKFKVSRAALNHTAAGGSETVSIAWSAYRDDSGDSATRTNNVSIVTQGEDHFFVGYAGDSHEVTLTHTGSAGWAASKIEIVGDSQDTRGAGKDA